MTADLLLRDISQLVSHPSVGPVHGRAMRDLQIIPHAALAVQGGRILWTGPESEWDGAAAYTVECGGRAVVPALIDPHTHAVWTGDRLTDFESRVSGVSYEKILAAGGGIRSTIRHTAAASPSELLHDALPRVAALLRSGAATIEVKSGYGFEPAAEIRILEAIARLQAHTPARLIPTLLIHIPPQTMAEREPYLERVRTELIPEVARRKLATSVDVFVEKESWSAEEGASILRRAESFRLAIKVHTEQFQRVGGLEMGVEADALSVDHLEVAVPSQFPVLARSRTVATILPGVTLHLGIAAAPGRGLIDAGVAVAIGTDMNPGSSPLFSLSMAMALAVRLNGLTPAEALTAATVNAAAALGLNDCGRLEPGQRADFLVLDTPDWRDIVYGMGSNPVREVWVLGRRTSA